MKAGHCSGLRDLHLNHNKIGAEGAGKLAAAMEAGHCSGLRDLDLSYNEIGEEGAAKFIAAMESGQCDELCAISISVKKTPRTTRISSMFLRGGSFQSTSRRFVQSCEI
jgi:hypothetical protein